MVAMCEMEEDDDVTRPDWCICVCKDNDTC